MTSTLHARFAVDAYNAVSDTWRTLSPLSSPRQKLAGALDESRSRFDELCRPHSLNHCILFDLFAPVAQLYLGEVVVTET